MGRTFQKVLVTGASGSGGSYLVDYIAANHPHVEIHGATRWHSTTTGANLSRSRDKVKLHECDLCDLSSVVRVLSEVKPDAIFHLAAYANVRASFQTPLTVIENNVMGTANLLEAMRLTGCDAVLQLASTSEVYGQVDPSDVPIKEDCPIRPSSPYAVSKTTQDLLGGVYFRSYGMKIVRKRMFAYIHPRSEDLFATSFKTSRTYRDRDADRTFAWQPDSTRTLLDVRDAMESYWLRHRFASSARYTISAGRP